MGRPKGIALMRHIIIAAAALTFISSAHATPWPTIEADNGSVFHIDQIRTITGSQVAIVSIHNEDGQFMNLQFDCAGHYIPIGGTSGWHNVPSRSVLARISQIACGARTHS
jgi:hypothetical protein